MGFEGSSGGLFVRSARPRLPARGIGKCTEVGNLDKALPGDETLPIGRASLDVLINRMCILGNPFHMKKNEVLRDAVIDAFSEYMSTVLDDPQIPPNTTLQKQAFSVAPKFKLSPGVHFSSDWLRDFGK